MKSTSINITKKQIETATKRNAHACMIAEAIREQIPTASYIHVDVQSIRFSDSKTKKRYTYFTPPEAQVAILNFDQGREVIPFKIKLARGLENKSGLKATHPNFVRKASKPAKRKHTYPPKQRQFGLCALVK